MLKVKRLSKLLVTGVLISFTSAALADADIGAAVKTNLPAPVLASGKHSMVVTNNPYASKAAQKMLDQGGSAVDAAIAAGFVLGLTEPQSSGIGGGGYALTFNKKNKKMIAYDGRETAPAKANPDWFLGKDGKYMDFDEAHLTAQAIGVPSEIALFYKMHQEQGKLPWAKLLQPAIELANAGFPMTIRLHELFEQDKATFVKDPAIKATYYTDSGEVKPIGSLITNVAFANTLNRIAANPQDFYSGTLAADIVNAINIKAQKNIFTINDMLDYTVVKHEPLCNNYRDKVKICSIPPSTSGGVTVLEILGLYSSVYDGNDINDPYWVHSFLEANKLAYADRNQYIADPAFVKNPVAGLLSPKYIETRSNLIDDDTALVTPVAAGVPEGVDPRYTADISPKGHGTTSLAVIDKNGNAITMTKTIENEFGSHVFVDGFFLNNELTDFSLKPNYANGKPIANRVEAGKRARSSIAPALVLDKSGNLKMLVGSPGGSKIICTVAKNLIQMLDLGQNPLQATSSGNLCAMNNGPALLEQNSGLAELNPWLKLHGEDVRLSDMWSGEVNIVRTKNGWQGASDPRVDGLAIGK